MSRDARTRSAREPHEANGPWYAERPLLLLLAVLVPLKLVLMVTAQAHLDGDEAVIGVMAMHVARGEDFPFYFWGQHYGGGSALAAHLTALPFRVFGPSAVVFRLIPMVFSLAAVVLAYRLVQSVHGRSAATVSTLLLLVSSALVEWFVKSRGGYVESTLLLLVLLGLLRRMETNRTRPLRAALAIGLTGGIAYYVQENALPFVAIVCASAVWVRRNTDPAVTAAVLAAGLAIGLTPVVVYNLLHDWQNLDYVVHSAALGSPSAGRAARAAARLLPALFQPRNFDCYPPGLAARTVLEAAVVVPLALLAALTTIVEYVRDPGRSAVFPTLSLFVLLFLGYALLSPRTATSPRYFFNLAFPMLLLCGVRLSAGLAPLLERRLALRALACAATLVLLVGLGGYSHARAFRSEVVADDVLLADGTLTCLWSPADDLSAAVRYLDDRRVTAVRSPYFSQWRIVFESGERIAASSVGLVPSASRRPELDRAVRTARRIAYVVHCASRHDAELRRRAPWLGRERFGDYCVHL